MSKYLDWKDISNIIAGLHESWGGIEVHDPDGNLIADVKVTKESTFLGIRVKVKGAGFEETHQLDLGVLVIDKVNSILSARGIDPEVSSNPSSAPDDQSMHLRLVDE